MVVTYRAEPRTKETGTIRVAVIGTGFGATVHIPALKYLPDTDVVAVCSRRSERARAIALEHNIPRQLTDFRELMRLDEIDAVAIAAPPYLHHQMALAAIEAGKHVLCEKPMARNLAESRDMVKMAQDAGLATMVNHEFRFLPLRARVKELIDDGYIGEPQAATMTFFRSNLADPASRPFGWLMERDKAGGMLGATGSHHVDALRWWFGEITAVAGATATMIKRRPIPQSEEMATVDADDNFALIVKFANGALGTVHVTTTAPHDLGDEIVLSGTEGILIIRDDHLLGSRRNEGAPTELPIPERLADGIPELSHPLLPPTIRLMREWVKAIRTGEPSSPSFEDGMKVQEVLDGVVRSSQQGRWIETGGSRWSVRSARP